MAKGGGGFADYILPAAMVAAPFALPMLGTAAAAGGGLGALGGGAMSGLSAGALPAAGATGGLFGGTGAGVASLFGGASSALPTFGAGLTGAASPFAAAAIAPEALGGTTALSSLMDVPMMSQFGVANQTPGMGGFMERMAGQFSDPQGFLNKGMEFMQGQQQDEQGQPMPMPMPMEAPGGPIAQSAVGPASQGQGFGGPSAYRPPPTAQAFGGGGGGIPPELLGNLDPMTLQMLMGKGYT